MCHFSRFHCLLNFGRGTVLQRNSSPAPAAPNGRPIRPNSLQKQINFTVQNDSHARALPAKLEVQPNNSPGRPGVIKYQISGHQVSTQDIVLPDTRYPHSMWTYLFFLQ